MKKKLLLLLIVSFCFDLCSVWSQIPASETDRIYTGPQEVLQFSHGVYTLTYYRKPSSGTSATQLNPQMPFGYIADLKEESLGNGFRKNTITYLFARTGTYTVMGGYTVTVKPNPLKLEAPSHVCPTGTQLITNASPFFEKRYTITGDPTAKVSESGILTYDPTRSGQISVFYEISYANNYLYFNTNAQIYLQSHCFTGSYYRNINGRVEYCNVTSYNYITNKEEVDIRMGYDYDDFTWEVPQGGAKNIQYNKALRSFKFTPTYTIGDAVKFRFKFKSKGCSQYTTFDCYFEIDAPYNVSYMASSNILKISRDESPTATSRIARVPDTYKLIDSSTGTLKKQGQLSQEVNEIDVSNISNGIYIVQITSGSKVKSYKISIIR